MSVFTNWRRARRVVLAALATLCALSVCAVNVRAQSRPGTATLTIVVLDARTSMPLPYSVVSLTGEEGERFTDARGQIALVSLKPGDYTATVRRIGFTPAKVPVRLLADSSRAVTVNLVRLPQMLRALRVSPERPCPKPGLPSEGVEPELAALVSLVRENAARHRLLAKEFPFTSMLLRAVGGTRDSILFVGSVTPVMVPSRTTGEYRAGNVVRNRLGTYSMALPTILDLAGEAFAKTHCFFYGGISSEVTPNGAETWIRLDVAPADKLGDPDVMGSFFLDSATASLRKMELSLSRVDKLPRPVQGIRSLQVSTRFTEIASGLSVISHICALTTVRPPVTRADSANYIGSPVELQQITNYAFAKAPPDLASGANFQAPPWEGDTYLPPSAIWCRAP